MRCRGRKGNFFLYPSFNKSSLPTLAKLPLSIFVALILFLDLRTLTVKWHYNCIFRHLPVFILSCSFYQSLLLLVFLKEFFNDLISSEHNFIALTIYIENWHRSREFLSVRITFDGLQTFAVL